MAKRGGRGERNPSSFPVFHTRSDTRSAAVVLAEQAPQRMRELLAPGVDDFCDCLMADVRDRECDGHRTAMGVYPRIMKAIGNEQDMADALLRALGVASMDALSEHVAASRSAEGVGLESATQQAITLLSRRIKSEPGFREECARTLFGVELGGPVAASFASVVDDAGAPVANGNGACGSSPNGHAQSYKNGGSAP